MSLRERLATTLLWLCERPSPTGREGPLCDAIAERLGGVALASPCRRFRNSLVVPVARTTAGPRIVLAGHLDVVPAEHDEPPRIDGDQLYGPGAADMKSGLALMLDLVENELARCRGLDLTLVFYAGEEGPYADNELPMLLAHEPELTQADVAVCLEPSENKLSLGACGTIQAGVHFRGRSAHSARPWQGDNAIHQAGPFLAELARLPPRPVSLAGLTFVGVTSATLAAGGRARNVVPDHFVLNVNHRFTPDQSPAEAQREFLALVGDRAEVEWRDVAPGALPNAEHPLISALARAGVEAVEPKQAWTDVASFALAGVAAVNFGPGLTAQAHQRNEYTSLTKLERGMTILCRWLEAIGGEGR